MGAPLDIALVFREADPRTGGLGIDITDVARGMAARGHRVTLLTAAAPADASVLPGVDVVELSVHPRGRRCGVALGLAPGAARALARRPGALVHVYSHLPVWLHGTAMRAARRARRPLVWTPMLHPARGALWHGQGLAGRAMAAFDALAPAVARATDAVAAATRAEAEHFRAAGARRVAVVPPAVPAATVASDEAAAALRIRLGIPFGPLALCVAGRPEPRKGLDFLSAVAARLRGRMKVAVLGLPEGAAAPPGVLNLGRVSAGELPVVYRAADVAVVPSRYEAFSRVVIEAWQQERGVVVTDRVGLAGEVEAVRGGRVVPFGDVEAAAGALLALLDDAGAGRRGRELVRGRYELEPVLDRMEQLYREVAVV